MLVSNFLNTISTYVSNPPFTSEEILNFARINLRSIFYPRIRMHNDGYFMQKVSVLTKKDVPYVLLPRLAYASTLVEVKLKVGKNIYDLIKINPSQVEYESKGRPSRFYHIRNMIHLDRIPDREYELIFWYEMGVPKLVNETEGREVESVSGTTITLKNNPNPFEHSYYDLIEKESGEIIALKSAVKLTNDDYIHAQEGDLIFKHGESGVIPVPDNLELSLLNVVSGSILDGMGDVEEGSAKLKRGIDLMNEVSEVTTRTTEANVLLENIWL